MANITRREFLKYSAANLGGLAMLPLLSKPSLLQGFTYGRVAADQISIYSRPDDTSTIVRQAYRDDLVNIYEDVISDYGPGYNPLWYRVWEGFIHSARVVKVQTRLNQPLSEVPKSGLLAEVTVPYTRTYHYHSAIGFYPIYRLYYGSVHIICGIEEGPDGQPYYRIRDELLAADGENYYAQAAHLRFIHPEEYSPLSESIPPEDKYVEVSLETQTLKAFEGSREVLNTKISSGIGTPSPNKKDPGTDTPRGEFFIKRKIPAKHMGGGDFSDDIYYYVLPGVPWASFITDPVAFHGVYWHNNFGSVMSSGCINMRTEEAKWLFRWSTPVCPPNTREVNGRGTRVLIY